MTEHPNAQDYRNRGERDAAYWREIADKLAEALVGVRCYANDVRKGHLIDPEDETDLREMATEDCERMVAALAEYEAARINAEALR